MKTTLCWVMLLSAGACHRSGPDETGSQEPSRVKLYWLIPDGLRADPDLFTLFEWARAGKLPHIQRMIENGAHGYSIPDFPSHTPTNFASLLTGAHPLVHGVADGPMHVEGAPLDRPSVGGFSSVAKKVPPVWRTLEAAGQRVALLSIPGSTPPELEQGWIIRGRWGGWGSDTPAIIFEPEENLAQRKKSGRGFKLFFQGQRLTDFVPTRPETGWSGMPPTHAPAREARLSAHGWSIWIRVFDSTDDQQTNFDTVLFAEDKKTELFTLKPGTWSPWRPVSLSWQGQTYRSQVRAKVIKLWPDTGAFRVRLFFNNANRFNTVPSTLAAELTDAVGPMVDFVDNWPGQLLLEEEDRATFLEEARDSVSWHRRAARFLLSTLHPDTLIQDTYTPNQMLETRWWLSDVDPERKPLDSARAAAAWKDLLELYQGIDAILGEAMAAADPNTVFVLSADHGIIPVHRQVRLNNLFARRGWLHFTVDEKTGEPAIDWSRTRVIYLKMLHVYINPKGLAGPWQRASGPAYEKLRGEVARAIAALQDENGTRPLVRAVKWEDAPATFALPTDRVGDLALEVTPGYTWWEEVSADHAIFTKPPNAGYKQAVNPRTTRGVWTPFVIMGPGVKKGVTLSAPISHVDQLPTILRLLNVPIPKHVQGRVLSEILVPE